jgi:Spherulation-specific family 4
MPIIDRKYMQAILVAVLVVGCAVTSSLWLSGAFTPQSPAPLGHQPLGQQLDQQLAVPSYTDPATDPGTWEQLTTSTPGRVGIAVANVGNGPTDHGVSAWASVIRQAHAKGIKVIGYVDTGYLGGPIAGHPEGLPTRSGVTGLRAWKAQIQSDVDMWYQLYGSDLAGIFFDQVPDHCGPAPSPALYADVYSALSDEVKLAHPGAMTVLNPGTAVPSCFEHAADILVTFEGSYAAYTSASTQSDSRYRPLSWSPVDPQEICHIVYGASSQEEMQQVMALSKSRRAGYVYVTDDESSNPYRTLPTESYWANEQIQSFPYGNPEVRPGPGST